MASLGALIASQPAVRAADAVVEEAAPAPIATTAINWSGAYIGVAGGYAFGGKTTIDPQGSSFDTDGLMIIPTVGYNYQFSNNVVLGIEGDVGFGNVDGKQERTVLGFLNVFGSADLDYLATVRGRVGYSFDRFLPYVTGGVAFAHINVKTGFADTPNDPVFFDDKTQVGYTVGGGVEYALTEKVSLKAEYNYVDLGTSTYTRAAQGPFDPETKQQVDFSTNVVKFGINYRF